MATPADRLAEIARRYQTDRQLFRSLDPVVQALPAGVPTFKAPQPEGLDGGTILFHFVGRQFRLQHAFQWSGRGAGSRVVLRADDRPGVSRDVAGVEIGDGGGVWRGEQATGLSLPADAAEVLALLLTLGGA